jgi:hypothetical protein
MVFHKDLLLDLCSFSYIYINDLPALINKNATPALFADNTSILITHSNLTHFTQNINMVLGTLNNRFNKNFLSLNFEKTQFTHFTTNNNIHINFHIGVDNKILPIVPHTKFLGLIIDSSLNWKKHIAHLTTKLGKACYALQSLRPYLFTQTLVTVYYSLFHSVTVYSFGVTLHTVYRSSN